MDEVKDTTGAGDCFAGGLIHSLAQGANIMDAVVDGSVMASFCIEDIGHRRLLSFSREEYLSRKKWLKNSLTS